MLEGDMRAYLPVLTMILAKKETWIQRGCVVALEMEKRSRKKFWSGKKEEGDGSFKTADGRNASRRETGKVGGTWEGVTQVQETRFHGRPRASLAFHRVRPARPRETCSHVELLKAARIHKMPRSWVSILPITAAKDSNWRAKSTKRQPETHVRQEAAYQTAARPIKHRHHDKW